jgi:hypothetical protein
MLLPREGAEIHGAHDGHGSGGRAWRKIAEASTPFGPATGQEESDAFMLEFIHGCSLPVAPNATGDANGRGLPPSAKVGRSAARGHFRGVARAMVSVGTGYGCRCRLMLAGVRLAGREIEPVGHCAGRAVQAIVEGEDDGTKKLEDWNRDFNMIAAVSLVHNPHCAAHRFEGLKICKRRRVSWPSSSAVKHLG